MTKHSLSDPTLLRATLRGLELELEQVEEQIAYIRPLLGHPRTRPAAGKRRMTPEGRQRMAAAQKKRWAAFHRQARRAKK